MKDAWLGNFYSLVIKSIIQADLESKKSDQRQFYFILPRKKLGVDRVSDVFVKTAAEYCKRLNIEGWYTASLKQFCINVDVDTVIRPPYILELYSNDKVS